MITRRGFVAGLSALPFAPALAADPLFAILDAVSPIEAGEFHPGRALAAMQALQPLGKDGAFSALRQYIAVRPEPPTGLFIVIRGLVNVSADTPGEEWPGVLQPGYLRPPALGAPHPEPPMPLSQLPRFPGLIFKDVPLSVVSGYILGGQPEPLSMHLDGLKNATWRTEPLQPDSAGSLRYLLNHWGQWPTGTVIGDALMAQLERLDHRKDG